MAPVPESSFRQTTPRLSGTAVLLQTIGAVWQSDLVGVKRNDRLTKRGWCGSAAMAAGDRIAATSAT
jgi:hypothetical protein